MKRIGLIRRCVKNESGATSVLVIFMMIVLVTFGAFAIASAHVNLKFAHAATDWTKMYYSMDAKGQEFLYHLDELLATAAYMADGDEDAFWEQIAELKDGQFSDNYGDAIYDGDFDDDFNYAMYIQYTIDDQAYHLTITATLSDPGEYPRYTITEWREWQNSAAYKEQPLWQPDLEKISE